VDLVLVMIAPDRPYSKISSRHRSRKPVLLPVVPADVSGYGYGIRLLVETQVIISAEQPLL